MTAIWCDDEGMVIGIGPLTTLDPGTGPDRYQVALDSLRSAGRPRGFASFTFDPKRPGSVVVIPRDLARRDLEHKPPQRRAASLLDDGIEPWDRAFGRAMEAISSGRVEKVVLSRQITVEIDDAIQPEDLVERLAIANPDCYSFAIAGLVGSSPELLLRIRDGSVTSLALAGTAARPEDLASEMIDEEHRHVADAVVESLDRHLERLDVVEREVVTRGPLSHLGTRVSGKARPGVTFADILAGLHPTPAVAGSPTEEAMTVIDEIETAPRGRYAGPVGWFDRTGDGVFALALRCGLVNDRTLTLYAGGGLLAGSDRDVELAETELKLRPMLAALGQDNS